MCRNNNIYRNMDHILSFKELINEAKLKTGLISYISNKFRGPKKKKVLFLQFNMKIDTHGVEDTKNFFHGAKTSEELFKSVLKQKDETIDVHFALYADVYRISEGFICNEVNLKNYDFVFFGFVSKHGTLPQLLQSYLTKYKVPFLRYESFGIYDSKAWGMELVESLGYPYIPSIVTQSLNPRVLKEVESFGYPVIVKDPNLDRGLGVEKVNNEKELKAKFKFNRNQLMIQKFIPNDGDFRVITMKNKMELVIKRQVTSKTEFRSNVALGGKAVPASLPKGIISMCEDISNHVNCDIIGFDILEDSVTGKFYVMEVNISPHFATFCLISDVNLPSIIGDYIIENIAK